MNATGTNGNITYTVCEQVYLMHDVGGRPVDDPRGEESEVYIDRRPAEFSNLADAVSCAHALAADHANEPEAHNGGRYSAGSVERTVFTVYGSFDGEDGETVFVDEDGAPCWNGDAPVLESFDPARDTFREYGEAFVHAVIAHGLYLDYEAEEYGGVADALQAIRAR